MTATPILEHLASEFSLKPEHVSTVLELIDAGLSAPYIGRVRRADTGGLSESMIRRVDRRRAVLEELDRRRGTILRLLEGTEGVDPSVLEEIKTCMDRFEIEDLFVPHRRPEPEVQLALDRGLAQLADQMVAPAPREARGDVEKSGDAGAGEAAASDAAAPAEGEANATASEPTPSAEDAAPSADAGSPESAGEAVSPGTASVEEASVAEASVEEKSGEEEPVQAESSQGVSSQAVASQPESSQAQSSQTAVEAPPEVTGKGTEAPAPEKAQPSLVAKSKTAPKAPAHEASALALKVELTPALARLCQPFVDPNKGVHSESEALSGATRILSDRVGRNAKLRTALRKMMRKQGLLSVRPTGDEKSLGRFRSLLKMRQPIKQVQGHKLLAIRQAQKDRILTTVIDLDHDKALGRVRGALAKRNHPDFDDLLNAVADRALRARLMPVIEEDVRLELKERGDDEALRLITQHFRQVLLAPPGVRVPVAGLDVNAKGDWTVAVIDVDMNPTGVTGKIETADKDPGKLGKELAELLGPAEVRVVAMGNGKAARAAIDKVRAAVTLGQLDAAVCIANEVGLSSYANSEIARKELEDLSIPFRTAVGLARRYRDPLLELLKVDPRHLRLGSEQALVSKANLRRAFREVIESCVAHTGCDVNMAPIAVLKHVPGLDHELAAKLIERRAQSPIRSREELRNEGLLTEAQWTSAAAFLRVRNGTERLDATSLHPDQYPLVRKLAAAVGGTVDELLGKPGATKGLRRADFDADEATWRDLMREISYPGRDPRLRNHVAQLMAAETDPAKLEKDQVVEGIVFNVASFGAFIDLGISKDGMVHISEVSDRYVRDARELLSVGQTVRCRVLDPSGQRISLSLKKVPFRERSGAKGRGRRREGGGRFAQDRSREGNVRAAQTRRDGLAGARSSERRGGRGGGGGGGGGRRGPGGRGPGGRGDGRRDGGEKFDPKLIQPTAPGYTPFANFFKEGEDKPDSEGDS